MRVVTGNLSFACHVYNCHVNTKRKSKQEVKYKSNQQHMCMCVYSVVRMYVYILQDGELKDTELFITTINKSCWKIRSKNCSKTQQYNSNSSRNKNKNVKKKTEPSKAYTTYNHNIYSYSNAYKGWLL